nr:hypothetical protein [uncultured Massilia sp.]
MEIPLNFSMPEKQKAFLDHFNAALWANAEDTRGRAGFLKDGGSFTSVQCTLVSAPGSLELEWTLYRSSTGELTHLVVEPIAGPDTDSGWKEVAYKFFTSVLASAFTDRKKKFSSRTPLFYVGQHLEGEYWLPGFRLPPCYLTMNSPII